MEWWQLVGIPKPEVVIGADEVGLGAYAGPLGVTAVAVPVDWMRPHLNDSKQLELWEREQMYPDLVKLPHSSFQAQPVEIDRDGVGAALQESFELVVADMLLQYPTAVVVLDGQIRLSFVQNIALPKADTLVPAVMAASVIAKVERDRYMKHQHKRFPQYGFDRHVGYGTPQHQAALQKHGICSLHRKSYAPIRRLLQSCATT
jgi:ribonuclease HII